MAYIYDLMVNNLVTFMMVFTRVAGIFTFNPIFSRNNTPARIKIGISLALSVVMAAALGNTLNYSPGTLWQFIGAVFLEMAVGLFLGFFVNLILTTIIYAGEIIDMQIGLAMAKVMDPATGSIPILASVYTYLFILYFFLTGGHLTYIRLIYISYETIPVGNVNINISLLYMMAKYISVIMIYAVKFSLPILVIEIITEVSIGILMKAVPSIHVFVINVQVKMIIGFLMIITFTPIFSDFLDKLMSMMWENLFSILNLMG